MSDDLVKKIKQLELQIMQLAQSQQSILKVIAEQTKTDVVIKNAVDHNALAQAQETTAVLAAALTSVCAEAGVDVQRVADVAEAAIAARKTQSQRAAQQHARYFVEVLRTLDDSFPR